MARSYSFVEVPMASPFESVTKVAIQEIVKEHTRPSKFGYIVTPEGYRDMCDAIYDLLVTSRTLKSAGDKFIGQADPGPDRPGAGKLRR